MKNMIHVGNEVSREFSENLESILVAVLTTIAEKRIDREVAIKALDTISQITEVKQITISNSTFTTNPIEKSKLTDEEFDDTN